MTPSPVHFLAAGEIESEGIGMTLYTDVKQKGESWFRRGVVDSFYIDSRSGLVSIGVDGRDLLDFETGHGILLMPKSSV